CHVYESRTIVVLAGSAAHPSCGREAIHLCRGGTCPLRTSRVTWVSGRVVLWTAEALHGVHDRLDRRCRRLLGDGGAGRDRGADVDEDGAGHLEGEVGEVDAGGALEDPDPGSRG